MADGRFRRAVKRLTAHPDELSAMDLRQQVKDVGATPVSACASRCVATVTGTIRTVTLRPVGGVPALEADLYDGSGDLILIWLGRRRIEGIAPGTTLVVEGRVGELLGRKVVYNPAYQLLPHTAE